MRKPRHALYLFILLMMSLFVRLAGQQGEPDPPHPKPAPKFKVRMEPSVMVPMRDGVNLSTDLYFPEGAGEKLPVILIRTPYSKSEFRPETSAAHIFAGQGFVVPVQDVRGKFESEGDYTVSAGDTNDGYDSLDWLAKQAWSTGKVGTYGCSYRGENQVEMARTRHPNHVAMLPQASGGALRYFGAVTGGAIELSSATDWFRRNGAKIRPSLFPNNQREQFASAAQYFNLAPVLPRVEWTKIWRSLPVIDILKKAGAPPSDYEGFVSHSPADPYWDQFGYIKATDRFNTPALFLDSWYDYGPADTLALFNLFQKNGETTRARENVFAIIAPTTHCVYARPRQQRVVGQRSMGTAEFDFYGTYLRWFDYWLKGIDNGVTRMPRLQIFVMGKNAWRGENEWPLARTQFTKFYLRSDGHANSRLGTGTLSAASPGGEPPDHYIYDPASPVPSAGGPDWGASMPEFVPGAFDQSEVELRNDVLVYTTPPLEKGMEVTGPLKVVLYVSSSAKDTDFTAKLVDLYPDGTAYNVQEGILRARYREGYNKTVWMKPDEVVEVGIDLQATSNYFGPGHRIRLDVSSSNFPRFDRNLNTGGNNYDETKWVTAQNAIHHSGKYSSYVLLPVIPED